MSLRPARGANAREGFVVEVRDRKGLPLHTTDCSTGASAVGEPRLASVLAAGGAHLRARGRGLGAATGAKAASPPPDYTAKPGGEYYADKTKLESERKANFEDWSKKRTEMLRLFTAEGTARQKYIEEYDRAVDAQLEKMREKMETLHKLLNQAQQGADKNDSVVQERDARISSLLAEKKALEDGKKAEIDAAVAAAGVEAAQEHSKLSQKIEELSRKISEEEKKDVEDKKELAAMERAKLAVEGEKAKVDAQLQELTRKLSQIKRLAGCFYGEQLETEPAAKK